MTETAEKVLVEALKDKKPCCVGCFCNDLCLFLLLKTGVATTCEDFRRRVRAVVDRELEKQFTKMLVMIQCCKAKL